MAGEVARHLDADAALVARYDAPGLRDRPGRVDRARPPAASRWASRSRSWVRWRSRRSSATTAPGRRGQLRGRGGRVPRRVAQAGDAGGRRRADHGGRAALGRRRRRLQPGAVPTRRRGSPRAFAELVGQAIANVDARLKLDESRARIVAGGRRGAPQDRARPPRRRPAAPRRPGASPRHAGRARRAGDCGRCARRAPRELQEALAELRALARGIHPVVLTERGLGPRWTRSPPVRRCRSGPGRRASRRDPAPGRADEAALYFVAAEALTNVAKYAQRPRRGFTVRRETAGRRSRSPTTASAARGGNGGTGLRGLADRIDALRGPHRVESAAGRGDDRPRPRPGRLRALSARRRPPAFGRAGPGYGAAA